MDTKVLLPKTQYLLYIVFLYLPGQTQACFMVWVGFGLVIFKCNILLLELFIILSGYTNCLHPCVSNKCKVQWELGNKQFNQCNTLSWLASVHISS